MIDKWVGSYEIKGLIGEGSSAVVYRAIQPSLGRPVAIKKLKLFQASDVEVRERFRLEALAQSKLSHPNIAVIYDFVRQYDSYFIITEMLKRRTLQNVITEEGRIAPDNLLPMFFQVLDAVGSAHSASVLHGDIRPSNIFFGEEGGLKVTDFGQSRIIGATAVLTAASVLGRVRYLSPEEIRRQPVDERSDVYALGSLLFEMATGKPAFSGDSTYEIMERHVKEVPPVPSGIAERIPKVVDEAVEKALQKSPDDRFQTVKEMDAFLKGDVTFGEIVRLNKRAFALYGDGNYRSALAIWRQVLKLDPENAKAQGGITRALAHIGEPEGKGLFETALEGEKKKASAAAELGKPQRSQMARHKRTLKGALRVLVRAATSPRSLQREPLLMFLLILMIGILALSAYLVFELVGRDRGGGIRLAVTASGEIEEPRLYSAAGESSLRSVRSDRAALAIELAKDARELLEQGKDRKALSQYEKAMELARGEVPEIERAYADCCVEIGKRRMNANPDTALQYFRKAVTVNPNSFDAYVQTGRILSRTRDYAGAVANYKKALSIEPNLPIAHFNLGHAYLSLKRYDEAAKEFQGVIGSGSDLVCDAYINLGVTYHSSGRLSQAEEVFSEGLKACPGNEDLANKRDQVRRQLKSARGKRG